jgi:hypothetical protein
MVCRSHNLVTDSCLKIFSGESIGLGVGRTIISELVNEVFANKTVWKSLGGTGSYVISTSPPGIQPAVDSLLRLKIFGYVCRLYVVSQRALPPPISILFAYALLARNGDADVIRDASVARMYAPVQMGVLDLWPALVSELKERQNEDNLKELCLQYFDKLVWLACFFLNIYAHLPFAA